VSDERRELEGPPGQCDRAGRPGAMQEPGPVAVVSDAAVLDGGVTVTKASVWRPVVGRVPPVADVQGGADPAGRLVWWPGRARAAHRSARRRSWNSSQVANTAAFGGAVSVSGLATCTTTRPSVPVQLGWPGQTSPTRKAPNVQAKFPKGPRCYVNDQISHVSWIDGLAG
jgi:hypothetical protein